MDKIEKIKLIAIVYNDIIKKSDAIICLEGDGYLRADWSAELFNKGLAGKIVVSGGYKKTPFSIPAKDLKEYLLKKNISEEDIILEEISQNTFEQTKEVMEIVKEKGWQKIILVASHFHQPRAYLTFLKAMRDAGLEILIFNAPVREIFWFEKTSLGKTRLELLEEEFEKIEEYAKKGHLLSLEAAIDYQKWKEKKINF